MLSTKVTRTLDLPYFAKYFLVAAFLASYNSPKDDKRLFVKNHAKKRKRLVQDQKKENASKELLGPKVFTLDRLLAIFYAIMEEKTPLNANLLAQVGLLYHIFHHYQNYLYDLNSLLTFFFYFVIVLLRLYTFQA